MDRATGRSQWRTGSESGSCSRPVPQEATAGLGAGFVTFLSTALGRDLPKLFLKILPRRVRLSPLPIVLSLPATPAVFLGNPRESRCLVSGRGGSKHSDAPTRSGAIVPCGTGRGQRLPAGRPRSGSGSRQRWRRRSRSRATKSSYSLAPRRRFGSQRRPFS